MQSVKHIYYIYMFDNNAYKRSKRELIVYLIWAILQSGVPVTTTEGSIYKTKHLESALHWNVYLLLALHCISM